MIYPAGTLLTEDEVERIDALGIDEVKVRTALTCDTATVFVQNVTAVT